MYPMGNISVKLGLEQLVSSNPSPHQNLIYFDLSKLAKRPLLGRHAPLWVAALTLRNPLLSASKVLI